MDKNQTDPIQMDRIRKNTRKDMSKSWASGLHRNAGEHYTSNSDVNMVVNYFNLRARQ